MNGRNPLCVGARQRDVSFEGIFRWQRLPREPFTLFGFGDHGIEWRTSNRSTSRDCSVGLTYQRIELKETHSIFVARNRYDWRSIFDVSVHGRLGGVVEERRKLIELLLTDWIEFVVMAHCATHGQP